MTYRLTLTLVAAIGLAACGGDDGDGEETGADETTDESSSTMTSTTVSTSETQSTTLDTSASAETTESGETTDGGTTGATGETGDTGSTGGTGDTGGSETGVDTGALECMAAEDEAACDAIEGCEWVGMGNQGNCVPLDIPCEDLMTQEICEANPACAWDAENEECADA